MRPVVIGLFGLAVCFNQTSTPCWVHGNVTDSSGQPVAGALVSLKAARAADPLLTISSADGGYAFRPLIVGADYELKADHAGLSSPVRTLQVANPDESVTIDLAVSVRIRFEDVAAKAGLHFTVRNGAHGKFSQPEIMLGGSGGPRFQQRRLHGYLRHQRSDVARDGEDRSAV